MVSPGAPWTGEHFRQSAFTSHTQSRVHRKCIDCFLIGEPRVRHLRSAGDGVHDQTAELLKDATKGSEGVWGKPLFFLL